MKETPEEYVITITDPVTGESFDFTLEEDSNLSLATRLVRKRSRLEKTSRSNFKKIVELREENNIGDLEKKITEASIEAQNLVKGEDESDEDFKKREDEFTEKVKKLQKSYPKEIIRLQNESSVMIEKSEDIGLKICSIILSPTEQIPTKYASKEEMLEDLLIDEQAISEVIDFFLTVYISTMKLDREHGSIVKIQKRKDQ